jgi:hypothetical protein
MQSFDRVFHTKKCNEGTCVDAGVHHCPHECIQQKHQAGLLTVSQVS